MYCPNCGAWNESNAQYCQGCGKTLPERALRSGPDPGLIIGIVIIVVGLTITMGFSFLPVFGDWMGNFGSFIGEWGSSFGRFMGDWGSSFGDFMANWGQNFGIFVRDSVRSLGSLALLLGLAVIGYALTMWRP